MVLLFDDMQKLKQDYALLFHLMPMERQQKASKLKFQKDRNQSVIAYALLRYGMDCCGSELDFQIDKRGKPYNAAYGKHFNLSHCKNSVACVISDGPCGIDVEHLQGDEELELLSNHVCCNQELRYLELAPDPHNAFLRLWTLKESYAKMLGDGLRINFRALDFAVSKLKFKKYNMCFESFQCKNYCLSYCSNQAEDLIYVSYEELLNSCETMLGYKKK